MARLELAQPGGNLHGGGVIISHRHILTSGFLLTPILPTPAVFIGGVTRNTQSPVIVLRRAQHPQYQASPRQNDIGIIETALEMQFNRFVQPIALPSFGAGLLPLENEQGTVLGFGGFPVLPNSENLQAAFMRATGSVHCQTRHPNYNLQQHFCAEDVRLRSDICVGDIGGPLIVLQRGEELLVGIASVHICQPTLLPPSQPSLFTRVSNYRIWINQETLV